MAVNSPDGSGKGPRNLFCTFRAHGGEQLEGFSIDPKGIITLRGPAGPISVEPRSSGIATYRSDGSPRPLVSVPNREVLSVDWIGALSRFDGLTAVDASGPVNGDRGRSIIVMAEISKELSQIEVACIYDVAGIPHSVNGEKLGWKLLVEDIMQAYTYRPSMSVAIVTDKAFGDDEHEALNRREKDVFPGWPLPPGFELVYAKEDMSPSDSSLQRAVRLCDRVGRDFTKNCRELPRAVTGDGLYTGVTRYVPSPGKPGWWLPTYKRPKGNAAFTSR